MYRWKRIWYSPVLTAISPPRDLSEPRLPSCSEHSSEPGISPSAIASRHGSSMNGYQRGSVEASFFDCAQLGHLGVRKLGRSVRNDAAVVAALKTLETRTFANGARVVVRDVDYSELSFEDQIATNLDTDVMVGPHGAGLMHNIFMPDRAALVELFIDGSSANRHFHNLARWQGRSYYGSAFSNPVRAQQLVSVVAGAVSSLDLSKPY